MASKGIVLGTIQLVLAMVFIRATAQSGCSSVLIGMASCLNYVSGEATSPSPSCCSTLANVVRSQPRCLCIIVNADGGATIGVSINKTLALELPTVCYVETPPVSRCINAVNGPAISPETSPPESALEFPGSPISPSVTGSKTGPSNGATSNGSMTNGHLLQLVTANIFVLIAAPYALTALDKIF
ncbi:lipid-transfer protein [Striga asiatica]|uniref:Lipid-transfer protein n=1 Tax=Striga asiatica TaxID=4170 RepID=A0A5A7PNF4_STRAF|nr:lipid-transfer protein [Striga asiatica]